MECIIKVVIVGVLLAQHFKSVNERFVVVENTVLSI